MRLWQNVLTSPRAFTVISNQPITRHQLSARPKLAAFHTVPVPFQSLISTVLDPEQTESALVFNSEDFCASYVSTADSPMGELERRNPLEVYLPEPPDSSESFLICSATCGKSYECSLTHECRSESDHSCIIVCSVVYITRTFPIIPNGKSTVS